MSQERYLATLLDKYGGWVTHTRTYDAPLDHSVDLDKEPRPEPESEEWVSLTEKRAVYVTLVGSLLWLAGGTRPDVSFAASTLARYVSNPGTSHLRALFRVISYLSSTKNQVLRLCPPRDNLSMEIYSDASWCEKNLGVRRIRFQVG